MSALNDDAIIIEYGDLYVGDDAGSAVNMGALRNIKFTSEPVTTVVNSDNRGEIIRKSRMPGKVEAELLEPGDADTLENIFKGLIVKSSNAASVVNNHPQVVASGAWSYNKFIPFEFQNGDGSAITPDSVTAGTNGALVSETDYFIGRDGDGTRGIFIKDSATVTTLSQTITIVFDYTPAASKVLTGGTNQTAVPRYIKIVAPSEDDSNTTREIVLESALATSPMLLAFVDVENAGDVGVMPVVFESRKGTAWSYTDEISVA
ncbi:MAG: hypothetical protein JWP89_2641 [Schlesneria sp.]|nr:hypothetical protein [Schlesneria sp.]